MSLAAVEEIFQNLVVALGANEAEAEDITHFMERATQDMHHIMASYDHDSELMHSSAVIAAAHAYRATDYKTKINERLEYAINLAGPASSTIRERIYQAIEGAYIRS